MAFETLRCGLLGRTLGHSYSPAIHKELAGYSYRLFEVEPEQLGSFLTSGAFDGLNVTIPYKKDVIPYCAELSETARAIGAVNTIVRRPDGTLWGDNTDAYGFSMLVQACGADVAGKKALVFGSGGASLTAQHVLKALGAREVVVISRHGADNYENLDRHADAQIAVNTTPLGMYPNTGVSPVSLGRFPKLEAALDVVYNPARTEFLLQAERLGIPCANGLLMLTAQAKKSCEDFTGQPVPDSRMKTAYTFNDGTTEGQESGGFAPTTSAKSIGLLLIPRRAASLIKKTEQVRCFDPAHNLQADAWKMDYRLYYDVVLKNGLAKGIYTYTF